MITDLIKYIFFTLLLNPMILVGIAVGSYVMRHYNFGNIQHIIYNKNLIFAVVSVSFLYAILFTHVYHVNSTRINWNATFAKTFSHIFTVCISAICTCFIIFIISHTTNGKMDSYLRNRRPKTTINSTRN